MNTGDYRAAHKFNRELASAVIRLSLEARHHRVSNKKWKLIEDEIRSYT